MTIEFEINRTGECAGFTWPTFTVIKNHIYNYMEHKQFCIEFDSMLIDVMIPIWIQPIDVYSNGLWKLMVLGVNEGEFSLLQVDQILFQLEQIPLPRDECLSKQFLKLYEVFYKASLIRSSIIVS